MPKEKLTRRKGVERAHPRYRARGVKTIDRVKLEKRKTEILGETKDIDARRREEFCFNYLDPKSPTFANIYASACEAGYSDSYARKMASNPKQYPWINSAVGLIEMKPEHIVQQFQDLALNNKSANIRLKALELLGRAQGMFIERRQVLHANIDEALREFEEDSAGGSRGSNEQEIIEASDIPVS